MARDIADIIKELDAGYAPERQLINQKLKEAPTAFQAQEAGLRAQEQDYFDNTILTGARNRGMGFSGIPEGERARYGASTYMPAVAKLKQSQNDYNSNLVSLLNQSNLDQRNTAQTIRQSELDRDEAARQFNEQKALAARGSGGGGGSGFSPSLNLPSLSTPTQQQPSGPSLQSFLAGKYASNPSALRSQQDAWVREWAVASGSNPNDPTLWAAYDKLYPWAQYNDAARLGNKITTGQGSVKTGLSTALSTSSGAPFAIDPSKLRWSK